MDVVRPTARLIMVGARHAACAGGGNMKRLDVGTLLHMRCINVWMLPCREKYLHLQPYRGPTRSGPARNKNSVEQLRSPKMRHWGQANTFKHVHAGAFQCICSRFEEGEGRPLAFLVRLGRHGHAAPGNSGAGVGR